jgi:FkbM family methyltransferase
MRPDTVRLAYQGVLDCGTALVRVLVPRCVRNALRRPDLTCRSVVARIRGVLGGAAHVDLAKTVSFRCHPICIAEFKVFATDPEQRAEILAFSRLAHKGMRLLDVGAHWGAFTLVAVRRGGETVRVIALEPSAPAAAVLCRNLALNDAREQVDVVQAACGASNGTIAMLTTGPIAADYFVVPNHGRPDTTVVRQTTVDAICTATGIRPTHVKIDVEGMEEEVLRGAHHTFSVAQPLIFIEVHGDLIRKRGRDPHVVIQLLADAGYTHLHSVTGDQVTRSDLERRVYNVRLIASHDARPVDFASIAAT